MTASIAIIFLTMLLDNAVSVTLESLTASPVNKTPPTPTMSLASHAFQGSTLPLQELYAFPAVIIRLAALLALRF